MKELGKTVYIFYQKEKKRFKVFVPESSTEEWTESLGTSAKTNSWRSDPKQETDGNQMILGTTLCSGYALLAPLKLAATLDCSFTGCFNVTLVVWQRVCHPSSVAKRWGPEKIWAIPLVQIILTKKQQDTGDLFASVVLGACQWRLTKPQHQQSSQVCGY